ncbi:hypothetical protein EDD11_004434 [Mortierella claussenii]|nr:hypothetical protein EDD11_004434 [Mortierella claussenii]
MHATDWERFKDLVWDPVRAAKRAMFSSEAAAKCRKDQILARKHHGIVLKHPEHHPEILALVEQTLCAAQIRTVGRWMNWGGEVTHRKTSPLGGAPVCFCGVRMVLSRLHLGQQDPRIALFCARRLKDGRDGCSRVTTAERWFQWQGLDPIHPLMTLTEGPMADGASKADTGVSSDTCSGSDSDSEVNLDISRQATAAQEVGKPQDATGRWTDDSVDEHSEPEQDLGDEEEPWDQQVNWELSQTCALKLFPLPTGLMEDVHGRIMRARNIRGGENSYSQELESTRDRHANWDYTSRGPESWDREVETPGDHCLRDNDQTGWRISSTKPHDDPWPHHVSTSSASDNWGPWDSDSVDPSIRTTKPVSARVLETSPRMEVLVNQMKSWHIDLGPQATMAFDRLQELESRLKRWQDSRGRLQDYSRGLQEDGLDNPTLKCRVCKEDEQL